MRATETMSECELEVRVHGASTAAPFVDIIVRRRNVKETDADLRLQFGTDDELLELAQAIDEARFAFEAAKNDDGPSPLPFESESDWRKRVVSVPACETEVIR